MFDALAERVQSAIEKIARKGRIDKETLEKGLREIKLALLEADVNYKIVSDFIKDVREKALGAEVVKGVNPAQQLVKIVYDELVKALGGETAKLDLKGKPAVILLIGLQGSGKTTTAAKLGAYLKSRGRRFSLPLPTFIGLLQCSSLKNLGIRLAFLYSLWRKKRTP
jgi:signal recognition particle subunit SRP54